MGHKKSVTAGSFQKALNRKRSKTDRPVFMWQKSKCHMRRRVMYSEVGNGFQAKPGACPRPSHAQGPQPIIFFQVSFVFSTYNADFLHTIIGSLFCRKKRHLSERWKAILSALALLLSIFSAVSSVPQVRGESCEIRLTRPYFHRTCHQQMLATNQKMR